MSTALTPQDFEDLAWLAGLKESASREAARLVLVEGLSAAEAGRRVGITRDAASKAVRKCRETLERAEQLVRRRATALP